MTTRLHGRVGWSGGRDDEGYLEYTIKHMVECGVNDGPAAILTTAGLPLIGSSWSFGDDSDTSVWCGTYAKVEYHGGEENDPHQWWTVEQKFSNRLAEGGRLKTCLDDTFENPLLEPQKVSGTFVQKEKAAWFDKDGNAIRTTSFERPQGDAAKFDETRATVKIEQNVAVLDLSGVGAKMNHVNATPLWGMAARCVKLSRFSWERKLWGTCSWYYTRSFEFDVDPDTFDRIIVDRGTMCLAGQWEGDTWVVVPDDPDVISTELPSKTKRENFALYKDKNDELSPVDVDVNGLPVGVKWMMADNVAVTGTAGAVNSITIQKYKEANFLLLGIPTTF